VNVARMFGTAMVIMPVTTAALNQLPQRLIPHGTAMNNTMRQIAASVGTAILITVMTSAARDPRTHGVEGLIHGANVSFFVAGLIGVVGILASPLLRSSTGTRRPRCSAMIMTTKRDGRREITSGSAGISAGSAGIS